MEPPPPVTSTTFPAMYPMTSSRFVFTGSRPSKSSISTSRKFDTLTSSFTICAILGKILILHPVFLHNSRIFFFRSPGRFGIAIKISCTSYFSAAQGILLSFPTIGAPRMVLPILFLSASITHTTRLRISGLFSIFFIRKFALSPAPITMVAMACLDASPR